MDHIDDLRETLDQLDRLFTEKTRGKDEWGFRGMWKDGDTRQAEILIDRMRRSLLDMEIEARRGGMVGSL